MNKLGFILLVLLAAASVSGCVRVLYKSTEINNRSRCGDAVAVAETKNKTKAGTISPQIEAKMADKIQGAENVKVGGLK